MSGIHASFKSTTAITSSHLYGLPPPITPALYFIYIYILLPQHDNGNMKVGMDKQTQHIMAAHTADDKTMHKVFEYALGEIHQLKKKAPKVGVGGQRVLRALRTMASQTMTQMKTVRKTR